MGKGKETIISEACSADRDAGILLMITTAFSAEARRSFV